MPPHTRRLFAALALALILAGCSRGSSQTEIDVTPLRTSSDRLYVISYTSEIDPVPINQLHAWTIHVESAEGAAVTGATVAVDGEMPAHAHGMPTRPQMTGDLGGGDYRVDGMKFQMPGHWAVTVTVTSTLGTDSATFDLLLQ